MINCTIKDKMYHIYLNGSCIAAGLNEEEFKKKYEDTSHLVELLGKEGDKLEYEECIAQGDEIEPSY